MKETTTPSLVAQVVVAAVLAFAPLPLVLVYTSR